MRGPNTASAIEPVSAPRAEQGFSLGNRLRNKFAVITMAGVAAAALIGGVAKAGGKEAPAGSNAELANGIENPLLGNPTFNSVHNLVTARAASDIEGPQMQIVCAAPSDQTPDMTRCEKTAQGMQNYMAHPQHGYPGLSLRLSGNVTPLNLPDNTAKIQERMRISQNNPNAPGNLQDFMTSSVQSALGRNSSTHYLTFITRVPNTVDACAPASVWGGMDIDPKTGANRNVSTIYINDGCDKFNEYHGFREPEAFMLEQGIHNEGFLYPCHEGFYGHGFSSIPDDNQGQNTIWWRSKIGSSYIGIGKKLSDQNANCQYLSLDPRFDWEAHASTNGSGSLTFSPSLDPGNRVEAGTPYEVKYSGKEDVTSWSGCQSDGSNSCTFTASDVVNIRANVQSTPPPTKKYILSGKVTGGAKYGSMMFNGRKSDAFTYPTTTKGQIEVIKPVKDTKNAYVKSVTGCENKELKRKESVLGMCLVKLDGMHAGKPVGVEKVNFVFATK